MIHSISNFRHAKLQGGALCSFAAIVGRHFLILALSLWMWSVPEVIFAEDYATKQGVVKPLRVVTVSASIREIIEKVAVEEGDSVEEGQILLHLRSTKQELAVERLEQMLRKAEFDYNAAKRLFEQKVASRDDAFQTEVELKRLEAELAIAKADLEERRIVAPLSGVVVRKFKESGESIAENDPILELLQTNQLLLLFHLEASLLPRIKVGQDFVVGFPAMPELEGLTAKLTFIDPEVDSRSGLFRVRLLLNNEKGLIRPGLRVEADFPAVKVSSRGENN